MATLLAWGAAPPASGFGYSTPPPGPPTVSAGGYMTCGIRAVDSNAVCWGDNVSEGPNQSNPPAGVAFTEVQAGYNLGCGIKTDQTLACWGTPIFGANSPPPGTFIQVAPGVNVACGLRTDGTIACWGTDQFGVVSGAPAGTFNQLSLGSRYGCAMNAPSVTITCWGDNTWGQQNTPVPPAGLTYTSMNTGNFDTCAIRSDGTADCWGRNAFGQDNVPAGTFTQISAGFGHVCGLRPDGTAECWGRATEGQTIVPPGTYNAISAGTFHTCGMRTDGVAVCWGNNAAGRVQPLIHLPSTDDTGSYPPPIVVGQPYSYQFQTSFVAPAQTWSVTQGDLPPGLTLSPTGLLSGTPTGSGKFSFTVTASNGFAPDINKTFTASELAVYRPSNNTWYVQDGPTVEFGTTGDIPVPADYDGDGDKEIAVFRPLSGTWFINGGPTVQFGVNGDIPVPADYDGDGADDIAVFRPSTGFWFVEGGLTVQWGTDGDIPAPGDFDGDGADEPTVFRPSNGLWFILGGTYPPNNTAFSTPTPSSMQPIQWGTAGDIPVPGDYLNSGIDQVAVFRPSTGEWYIRGGIPSFVLSPNQLIPFGTAGDIPVPADYDGDGSTDVAVFRPSNGVWYVHEGQASQWGTSGDTPLPGFYVDSTP